MGQAPARPVWMFSDWPAGTALPGVYIIGRLSCPFTYVNDARATGNDPNCKFEPELDSEGRVTLRIQLVTLHKIKVGAQLTVDYGYADLTWWNQDTLERTEKQQEAQVLEDEAPGALGEEHGAYKMSLQTHSDDDDDEEDELKKSAHQKKASKKKKQHQEEIDDDEAEDEEDEPIKATQQNKASNRRKRNQEEEEVAVEEEEEVAEEGGIDKHDEEDEDDEEDDEEDDVDVEEDDEGDGKPDGTPNGTESDDSQKEDPEDAEQEEEEAEAQGAASGDNDSDYEASAKAAKRNSTRKRSRREQTKEQKDVANANRRARTAERTKAKTTTEGTKKRGRGGTPGRGVKKPKKAKGTPPAQFARSTSRTTPAKAKYDLIMFFELRTLWADVCFFVFR
jgi:hypothetical protein